MVCFVCVFWFGLFVCLFACFRVCFLIPFASLHALALLLVYRHRQQFPRAKIMFAFGTNTLPPSDADMPCIRVRFGPALVSLLSLSFHLADGLIFCLWFLVCLFLWFILLCLVWSLTGSSSSVDDSFRSIAPLPFSLLGHHSLPWSSLVPHRPVFHISSHPFHLFHSLQRALLGCGVSGVFCFVLLFCLVFSVGLFVCLPVFGFLFLFPFASLHALALSLTGAQRTDSSSASKKKFELKTFCFREVWKTFWKALNSNMI